MFESIKQWAAVITGGVIAWPVASWVLASMQTSDGWAGAPLTLCSPLVSALVAAVCGVIGFGVISIVVGRVTNRYTGMLMYGLCWMIVARRGVSIDAVLRHVADAGGAFGAMYVKFAIETCVWAIPVAALMAAHVRLSPNAYPHQESRFTPMSLKALACNIVLGVALGWVFLRTEAKGQTVFGFAAASAIATMVTRLIWPRCNASILFVVPAVVGVVAAITTLMFGASDAVARMAAGDFWALGRLMPPDAMSAGTFGTALGIGLARSFGAEHHPAMAQPAPQS